MPRISKSDKKLISSKDLLNGTKFLPAAAAAAAPAKAIIYKNGEAVSKEIDPGNFDKFINISKYLGVAQEVIEKIEVSDREINLVEFSQLSYYLNLICNNILYLRKSSGEKTLEELKDLIDNLFPESGNYWFNLVRLTSCHTTNYGKYFQQNKDAIVQLFEKDFFAKSVQERISEFVSKCLGAEAVIVANHSQAFEAIEFVDGSAQTEQYDGLLSSLQQNLASLNASVTAPQGERQIFKQIYLHYLLLEEVVNSPFELSPIKINLLQAIANLSNELVGFRKAGIIEFVQASYLSEIILIRNELAHNINFDGQVGFNDNELILLKRDLLVLGKKTGMKSIPNFDDLVVTAGSAAAAESLAEAAASAPADGFTITITSSHKRSSKAKNKVAKKLAAAKALEEEKILDDAIAAAEKEMEARGLGADYEISRKEETDKLFNNFYGLSSKLSMSASHVATAEDELDKLIEIFNEVDFDVNRIFKLEGKYYRSFEILTKLCKELEINLGKLQEKVNKSKLLDYKFWHVKEFVKYCLVSKEFNGKELLKWLDDINHPEFARCIKGFVDSSWSMSYKEKKHSEFTMAAHLGFKNRVLTLLDEGQDVNELSGLSESALMLAADNGHEEIVAKLLAAGAEVNIQTIVAYGSLAALIMAAQNGHEGIVAQLLAAGAKVAIKDANGRTPLMLAAKNNHEGIVDKLLAAGADVNELSGDNRSALMLATIKGNVGIVDKFLAAKAKLDVQDAKGGTALIHATCKNHREIAAKLLAAGADINIKDASGFTALFFAAQYGYKEIVAQLLAAGADVNITDANGYTSLIHATCNNHSEIVAQLLAAKAKLDVQEVNGATALIWAAVIGNVGIVDKLLAAGATLDIQDAKGATALIHATCYNHPEIVAQLLAAGADVNIKDANGYTVLIHAAFKNYSEIVDKLLAVGLEVDAQDANGATALMWAAQCGHKEVATKLLAVGADVNIKDNVGRTALKYAAENSHREIVKILFEKAREMQLAIIETAEAAEEDADEGIMEAQDSAVGIVGTVAMPSAEEGA